MIAGNTLGCFGVGCTPGSSATRLGLTYNNSTFGATTSNGFLGIGNNAGIPDIDNLGSFTLGGTNTVYTGKWDDDGSGRRVHRLPRQFTSNLRLHECQRHGLFTFSVNDVTVQAGRTFGLSGNIIGAQQTAVGVRSRRACYCSGSAEPDW